MIRKLSETYHEKIMISKDRIHNSEEIDYIITNLKTLENYYNPEHYKNMIKKLLPEYKLVINETESKIDYQTDKIINEHNYQN